MSQAFNLWISKDQDNWKYYTQPEIVSGGAQGVDFLAELYAKKHTLKFTEFKADWDKYGKSAGIIRNTEMAKYADALVAVWDGKSKGTMHMICDMVAKQKPVFVLTC